MFTTRPWRRAQMTFFENKPRNVYKITSRRRTNTRRFVTVGHGTSDFVDRAYLSNESYAVNWLKISPGNRLYAQLRNRAACGRVDVIFNSSEFPTVFHA